MMGARSRGCGGYRRVRFVRLGQCSLNAEQLGGKERDLGNESAGGSCTRAESPRVWHVFYCEGEGRPERPGDAARYHRKANREGLLSCLVGEKACRLAEGERAR
ncbi:hypothetical protein HRbin28_00165 [bacterium HR28]|nr:hypothetical protein HRbin28_00165 [bacterium HR28]